MIRISDFTLRTTDFTYIGQGLARPECVWVDHDGIWVSDARGGVSRIDTSGVPQLLGQGVQEANGFSRRRNGAFVVAGLCDGAVHQIHPDGRTETLLNSLDGHPLGSVNFAWVDSEDRIWVSVMTRRPRWYEAINQGPDGYIILIDERGARVVADGLHLTNEVKVHPNGVHLYAVETLGRRIVRFPVGKGGTLGSKEIVGPADLGHGANPDGIAFDADGNIWVTLINRNAISVITPSGDLHTIYEELQPAALDCFVAAMAQHKGTPEQMVACAGRALALPTSIAFGGEDGRSVYVGSLLMQSLAMFRSPVGGK